MDETTFTGSTDSEGEPSWSGGSHDTRQVAPRIIDLKQVDVDALWQSHRLSGYLCLYWDGVSKASLTLQVDINIAAKHSISKKSNLYLVISPERIRRVSILPDSDLPDSETQSLHFVLSRPPFLVEPSQSWEPRDDVGKKTRDLLYGLASQTQFSLCTGHVISSDDAHSFCMAAVDGGLSMAIQDAGLRRSLRGGGYVVEGDALDGSASGTAGLASSAPGAPVPEYSESPALGLAPAYRRSSATRENERKRRRTTTEHEEVLDNGKRGCGRPAADLAELLSSKSIPYTWGRLSAKIEQLAEVERRMSAKMEQLTEAEGRIAAKMEQLTEAQVRISAIPGQLTEAEGRISITMDQLSEQDSRISAAVEQLSGVEGRISTVAEKLLWTETHANKELRQIGSKLREMESGLESRREILEGVNEKLERNLEEMAREIPGFSSNGGCA
ncbi:hypothetical protein VM1G_06770 [Cytospora mali]|uniref:Uncharacterized protein n=1 Tax=Cytospora mali TaxID=578113 RepID=A0A194W5K3_CYTMA|nr:hypothetical protein VM1G_06770 [Valsa mali]